MRDKPVETYLLPSGAEIQVQTIEDHRSGASDAAYTPSQKIPFEEVIAPLGEVADVLLTRIKSCVKAPDSVTLEFAASLKGKTTLLIVSGEGEGSIKVSLTWNKPQENADSP